MFVKNLLAVLLLAGLAAAAPADYRPSDGIAIEPIEFPEGTKYKTFHGRFRFEPEVAFRGIDEQQVGNQCANSKPDSPGGQTGDELLLVAPGADALYVLVAGLLDETRGLYS